MRVLFICPSHRTKPYPTPRTPPRISKHPILIESELKAFVQFGLVASGLLEGFFRGNRKSAWSAKLNK